MFIKKIVLSDGSVIHNVDTVNEREYLVSIGVNIGEVEAKEAEKNEAIEARQNAKMNADYNGVNVSLTSADALGLLQVQSAFSLGETETTFFFANGTQMQLKASEFIDFSRWFAHERNLLFV